MSPLEVVALMVRAAAGPSLFFRALVMRPCAVPASRVAETPGAVPKPTPFLNFFS